MISLVLCLVLGQTPHEVINQTNSYRIRHGIAPLVVDNQLMATSQQHSQNMATRYGFRHGGTLGWSAENIASGGGSVAARWYNSSGHRANMLNSRYTRIGVGYYNGMWTQQFR